MYMLKELMVKFGLQNAMIIYQSCNQHSTGHLKNGNISSKKIPVFKYWYKNVFFKKKKQNMATL